MTELDETLKLVKLAQNGDNSAKDRLIRENSGLVWSVVKRFAGKEYETEDLFQIGSIGLIKSIDKFDFNYNVKFSTYAIPMILGEIKRFLRDDGLIKVSRSLKNVSLKAKYKQNELIQKYGKTPTLDELAAAVETNVEDLVLAMGSGMEVESLYQTINHSNGSQAYLIDRLEQCEGESENMIDIIALKQIISQLSPKEQRIIILRYFKDQTQIQVAKEIGVSQVQVSRIEKRILKTMKDKFTR